MDNTRHITYDALSRCMRRRLAAHVGDREAGAIVDLLFDAAKGWSRSDLILNGDKVAEPETAARLLSMTDRVERGEPAQYVTGHAWFYGMRFEVNQSTLIPRPETAMLVDMIVKENKAKDLRVLDLGTGSGCIAVALACNLPFARVTALDISPYALQTARRNAIRLKADIEPVEADMLSWHAPQTYDIIVSNPPYVLMSERNGIEPTVLDYEPHMALFVPDDDPLRFYKAVVRIASESLADDGKIYLEINPLCCDALCRLLSANGFDNVTVSLDIEGRKRFITASR